MKAEKKYSEVANVVDKLESWVFDINNKADLISRNHKVQLPPQPPLPSPQPPTPSPPQPPPSSQSSSRPDQPLSRVSPVTDSNDPKAGVKVQSIGDQIKRVRFAGAKDLWAGCHSASDRFDHLYPFRVADWHCKQSFFKVFYYNPLFTDGTLKSQNKKVF